MKRLLAIGLLALVGCSTLPKEDAFNQIRDMPYHIDNFNCRDKAQLYLDTIKEDVRDIKIAAGTVEEIEGYHAWVEYRRHFLEPWRLADPTLDIESGHLRSRYDGVYTTLGRFNNIGCGD